MLVPSYDATIHVSPFFIICKLEIKMVEIKALKKNYDNSFNAYAWKANQDALMEAERIKAEALMKNRFIY